MKFNEEQTPKAKRVSSRIGDIFCVELDTDEKVFFQYIANDLFMLNSSVIRVFRRHYPLDYTPSVDEIVSDEVQFYAHTMINIGQKSGVWNKIGKSKDVGDVNDALFRNTGSGNINNLKVSDWILWHLNSEIQKLGKLPDEIRVKSHIGKVLPIDMIVHKIKFGEYYGYMDLLR